MVEIWFLVRSMLVERPRAAENLQVRDPGARVYVSRYADSYVIYVIKCDKSSDIKPWLPGRSELGLKDTVQPTAVGCSIS